MIKSLVFLLASLLLCSGIPEGNVYFDHPNPGREMEFSYHDKAVENKQIINCGACMTILRVLIKRIGKTASKDEVNRQLDRICEKIIRIGCKNFLQKYKNKLVNELLSRDKPRTICIKLQLCKQM